MALTPDRIRDLIGTKNYRFSQHGEVEREADQITIIEFEEAFLFPNVEIIEINPENARGFSCLALAFTKKRKPIHAVFGKREDVLVVVTIYRPAPNLWIDYRKRR